MTKQTTFTVSANAIIAFVEALATHAAIIRLDDGQRFPALLGGDAAPLVLSGPVKDGIDSEAAVLTIPVFMPYMLASLADSGMAPSVKRGHNFTVEAILELPEPINVDILEARYGTDDGIGDADDGLQASGAAVSATIH